MSEFKHICSKETTKDSIGQLRVVARKLYDKIPLPFRWIAFPLTYCDRLFLNLRIDLWLVTGDEPTSRKPMSILCAAKDTKHLNYLLGLAFGASFRERYLGRAWLWRIPKVVAEMAQDCSLMIVQVPKSRFKLLRSSNWFYIPCWVVGEIDIPRDPTVTKDSSLKSDFRRIRKNSLRYEVTRDPQRFDDFYHNMYVPQTTKAHGSSAYIISYEYMRAEFQNCDLLLVTKQEKHIAGILIAYEKSGPRLWSLGVRDSNPEYIKDGAVGALFYFSISYLHEKGFTKVEFGRSRPFLRDGVLRYKRKWDQRIVGTSPNWLALKILSYPDAVKVFLQQNPFIFENRGSLNGAVFVDEENSLTAEDFEKIDKQHLHDGLSKLFIYSLQQGDPVKQNNVPSNLAERIVLRSAKDRALKDLNVRKSQDSIRS